MRKNLFVLAVLLFGLCGNVQAADEGAKPEGRRGNPVDQFTGDVWEKTPLREKGAFLFGIDTAVTVEYFINRKMAEKSGDGKRGERPEKGKTGEKTDKAGKGKRVHPVTLSPFERGWMKAFKGVERAEIIRQVDAWYKANPDHLDRPVMSVIWHELVKPRLAEKE